MPQENPVRYEVIGGAAVVTLDSPHNRNAISTALVDGLHEALDRAVAEPAARAVVLTHTGGTFCAGADLSEASTGGGSESSPAEQAAGRTRVFLGLLRKLISLPKPVIARIDGHVRAGGMGLVAAADLAVAGSSSTFALTEARLGLSPAMVSLPLLARVGPRATSRMFLTGSGFGPERAAEIGLVTESAEDTSAAVHELLAQLRKGSPQGLAESKALLTRDLLAELDARGEELASQSARLFTSEEAAEGMSAFLEKRAPRWAAERE